MNVLDLAIEIGLEPRRTSSTNGGEFHSTCPVQGCGGKDRFCIWPDELPNGRYWCRQCQVRGDAIQFCRDFLSLTFQESCEKVGQKPLEIARPRRVNLISSFSPLPYTLPSGAWQKRACDFVESSFNRLKADPTLINRDKDRGISPDSISRFMLGWNSFTRFEEVELWGLNHELREGKKICLPEGIVIPSFRDGQLCSVKIRRAGPTQTDGFAKYQIIPGGACVPLIHGRKEGLVLLLESELDSVLVQQEVGDLCTSVALGSVSMKPDLELHEIFKKAPAILYALDFDDAGKKRYGFWRSLYSHLYPWPVPKGKSPGDAYLEGVNLRMWVEGGLKTYFKGGNCGK